MAIDVFISVGTTEQPEQKEFIESVEQFLQNHGLNPRRIGKSDFPSGNTLAHIKQMMNECSGTVIIALERIYIENGMERRNSTQGKILSDVKTSTVWNHIEASMAYMLGQPLFVLVESGLKQDGLLEPLYGWYIQSVDIDSSTLHSREFDGRFDDWQKRVKEFHDKKGMEELISHEPIDPEKLTIGQIFGSLKPAQLWALGGALIAALTALAVSAYKLGSLSSSPGNTSELFENQPTIESVISSETLKL
jgi:hypothetical protein